MASLTVPQFFQGPTGSGQGGWTAAKLVHIIGHPATTAIRAPIPLDTPLDVVELESSGAKLVDPATSTVILEAVPWEPDFPSTAPVTLDAARQARARFPVSDLEHPVPMCFSCGLGPDTMHVHAGPLGDGRFAADWRVPDWACRADGSVDEAVIWAAIDCTAAWYVCYEGEQRTAFTVQFATEVLVPLRAGETYALVGWAGDWEGGWHGRKRGAASAAFDSDGVCVAHARSFWVSVS